MKDNKQKKKHKSNMKPKDFIAIRSAGAENGLERKLVVIGRWRKDKLTKEEVVHCDSSTFVYRRSVWQYSLTLAKAICHPDDIFDENVGIRKAISRLKSDSIGKLITEDYTMLTPDACQEIVNHKADYIARNIAKFLPKE